MTVTRVDGNVAGSGNSAAPTTARKTASANIERATGWSAVPMQIQKVRGVAVTKLPPKTRDAINNALKELSDAKALLDVASDKEAAKTTERVARANVGQVIADQTNKLSQRSSLVPKGERSSTKIQPASCLQVR